MNRDSFISSFPIYMRFILPTRTSSMRMNRSDENRQTCLVPDPRRKAFSLLPLNRILAVIFVNYLYQVKEVPFYS